ncbi:Uncharacterised protein [Mycobacteroides abscessus subsp. bolletii]|nr:Uncharacterised protein [Mycobacteroides abscessus subsp. bolletii]
MYSVITYRGLAGIMFKGGGVARVEVWNINLRNSTRRSRTVERNGSSESLTRNLDPVFLLPLFSYP